MRYPHALVQVVCIAEDLAALTADCIFVAAGILSVDEARDIMRNDEEGPFTGISTESPQKDEGAVQKLMAAMGEAPADTEEGAIGA